MSVLKFKKGVKDWDQTYEVDIKSEYTSDLEKRITDIVFCIPKNNKRIRIPWNIFESYLSGSLEATYADAEGISIHAAAGELLLTDGKGLELVIRKDQLNAIRTAASKTMRTLSPSVKRIHREIEGTSWVKGVLDNMFK